MRVLILCQEYPASDTELVFVHAADVANELACRGHSVTVLATNRGTGALGRRRRPSPGKPAVHHLPLTWFGKMSYLVRILAALSFFAQAALRLMLGRRVDVVVVSTAPPMIGPVATVAARIRRIPVVFWAMDLNPDQLAAIGRLDPARGPYRLLDGCMRWFVRRCSRIIALDDAMADRLVAKGADAGTIIIVAPWADDRHLTAAAAAPSPATLPDQARRVRTLLYCGNLSPSNPIAPLLAGFAALPPDHGLRLRFRGSGRLYSEAVAAARHDPSRITVEGPVPAADLAESLAEADVHVATMGRELTGILHPSKVYAALAAGRPILFIGPLGAPSARLVREANVGWTVPQEPDRVREALESIAATPTAVLAEMGLRARQLSREQFAQELLTGRVAACVEAAAGITGGPR